MPMYPAPQRGYGLSTTNLTVLVPTPSSPEPTAGHWRTDPAARPAPKPRLTSKPTGGKVDRMPVAQYPRKRKSAPKIERGRDLHAAWSRGKLEF